MVQVSDVHEVRAEAVEEPGEAPVDAGLPVAIPVARVVDNVQRDPRVFGVGLDPQAEVGGEEVLLAGEDVHLVAFGESVAEGLRVDLGPGVVAHGVAVDDLEDLHGVASWCWEAPAQARRLPKSRSRPSRNPIRCSETSNSLARDGSP